MIEGLLNHYKPPQGILLCGGYFIMGMRVNVWSKAEVEAEGAGWEPEDGPAGARYLSDADVGRI
jgi:hypothetical protein